MVIALRGAGISVPNVLAIDPTREATLSERVPGDAWLYRVEDPAEQISMARDLMAT